MSLCAHSLLSISMSQWSKNKIRKKTQLRIESDLKEKVGMCPLMEMWIYTDILGFVSKEREKER